MQLNDFKKNYISHYKKKKFSGYCLDKYIITLVATFDNFGGDGQ